MRNEVDFQHIDKHKSFLQIDTMILMGMVKHSQSFQIGKFAMSLSLQYFKEKVRDEVDFLHADKNIKVSYTSILTIWESKFATRWYYHY